MLQDWLWERGNRKAEIQGSELVNHHYVSYGTQFPVPAPSLRTGKKDGVRNMGEKLILGRERQEAERREKEIIRRKEKEEQADSHIKYQQRTDRQKGTRRLRDTELQRRVER